MAGWSGLINKYEILTFFISGEEDYKQVLVLIFYIYRFSETNNE